jgi:hypothetical protein
MTEWYKEIRKTAIIRNSQMRNAAHSGNYFQSDERKGAQEAKAPCSVLVKRAVGRLGRKVKVGANGCCLG